MPETDTTNIVDETGLVPEYIEQIHDLMKEPQRIVREVSFEIGGDGRTIEARVVPYNQTTQVVDLPEHGGTGIPYLERWLPGAFEKQANAANRVEVWLNFEHEDGLRGIVGHGVALREKPDALYGTFRVHPNADGDKVLHMVKEGILTGLSIEAIPTRTQRTLEGIVDRARARLDKVSLCRGGRAAYGGAQVLAVREAPEEPEPEPEPEPTPDPELEVKRTLAEEALARIGYTPILRRAVVRGSWDGSAARYDDDEWQRACVLDRGDTFDTPKTRYGFPVLEPNGDLNVNGMHAAAGRLNQANATPQQKAAAARKLIRFYNQAGEDPPPALSAAASR